MITDSSRYSPVLRGHALHTSTDTNLDHTRPDGIRNVNDGLQTARALAVQALHSGGLGEASHKGRGPELSSATAGRKDRADSNIFNDLGVDAALSNHGLEDTGQKVSSRGVFEATLATLGQGSPQRACHDNVIGVFLGESGGSLLATGAKVGGNLE